MLVDRSCDDAEEVTTIGKAPDTGMAAHTYSTIRQADQNHRHAPDDRLRVDRGNISACETSDGGTDLCTQLAPETTTPPPWPTALNITHCLHMLLLRLTKPTNPA